MDSWRGPLDKKIEQAKCIVIIGTKQVKVAAVSNENFLYCSNALLSATN